MRVALLTTYSEPCGIAEYAKSLVKSLEGVVDFDIYDRDRWNIATLLAGDYDILHLNHEGALFHWFTLPMVEQIKATGKKVVMTLHSSCHFNRSAFTLAFSKVVVHHKTND